MALEIKGINNLLRKLNELQHIDTKKVVEEVANELQLKIRDKAKKVSPSKSHFITTGEVRCYKNSNYIDVGLNSSNATFEMWKELYYHNFGYSDKGWGNRFDGMMITNHQLWFNNAISESGEEIKKELKSKVKKEIKKALGG